MTEIEHITDEDSHGPVAIFLSDEGRIGFVCRRDGAYWEGDMPQLTAPRASADAIADALADAGVDLKEKIVGGPRMRILSMEATRGIQRKHGSL
ncbi:hypothetical protein ACI3ET_11945 [Ornithinimicrobium sp. LYQ121]|uniref:hypothetical protein n=1 Tax=Ornithinimicrobium sp. LYQ121 TaxID=3378801 RepID=UPI00385337C5